MFSTRKRTSCKISRVDPNHLQSEPAKSNGMCHTPPKYQTHQPRTNLSLSPLPHFFPLFLSLLSFPFSLFFSPQPSHPTRSLSFFFFVYSQPLDLSFPVLSLPLPPLSLPIYPSFGIMNILYPLIQYRF